MKHCIIKSLSFVLVLLAQMASAQTDTQTNAIVAIEEVVISAQAIDDNLQNVPIAINVVSGQTIQDRNLINLFDIANQVPGFIANDTAISSILSIRGISSGTNQGFEQSVGNFIDGAYISRENTSKVPLFDIEQIEVLKGPQSILFDRSTIGGAIVVKSKRPDLEGFGGDLVVNYSPETDLTGVQVAVNVPVTDDSALRVSLINQEDDGYYYNQFLDTNSPASKYSAVRVSYFNEFSENNQLYLKYQTSQFDLNNTGVEIYQTVNVPSMDNSFNDAYVDIVALLSNRTIDVKQDYIIAQSAGFNKNTMDNFTLEWSHSNNLFDLTANTSYFYYDNSISCDCDFTPNNDFTLQSGEKYSQLSQQFLFKFDLSDRMFLLTQL